MDEIKARLERAAVWWFRINPIFQLVGTVCLMAAVLALWVMS